MEIGVLCGAIHALYDSVMVLCLEVFPNPYSIMRYHVIHNTIGHRVPGYNCSVYLSTIKAMPVIASTHTTQNNDRQSTLMFNI